MASYFRLSGTELEHLTEVPSPVQTSFEMELRFTVIRQKSFCCYDFPSSNPVATLGQDASLIEVARLARSCLRKLQDTSVCRTEADAERFGVAGEVVSSGLTGDQFRGATCRQLPNRIGTPRVRGPSYDAASGGSRSISNSAFVARGENPVARS